jgi:small-conductance mechanosensitive channel
VTDREAESLDELGRFIHDLDTGSTGWGIWTLVGCLAIAYSICWLLGRRRKADSIWFGRALFDGVLFPALALGLTYTGQMVVGSYHAVPLLRIAVPVLAALAGIRLIARVFTVVFPTSSLARLVERLFSWMAWAAAALWILGLLPTVMEEMEKIQFSFGKANINLLSIVQGVLSTSFVLAVSLWVSAALEQKVLRDTVADLSLRKVAASAIRAVLLLLGVLFALSAVGVDLTALSVLGGALGVGLGFGLQRLASNYVSGFVILFERSLRIGDTVRVENFEGVVVDIKTRYTLIRSLGGRESVVPNEKLVSERIENLSLADPRLLLTTQVAVSYEADVEQVKRILLDAAAGVPRVLAEPGPGVQLKAFGADGLEFVLFFWIEDPQNGQGGVISDVNFRILAGLRAAGIDIPYPQRVVHMIAPPTSSGTAATG